MPHGKQHTSRSASPGFTAIHANHNSCTSQSVLERVVIGRSGPSSGSSGSTSRESTIWPEIHRLVWMCTWTKLIPERSCAGRRRPRAWRSLAAVCHTARQVGFLRGPLPLLRQRCSGCASSSLKGGPQYCRPGGWLLRRRPVAVTCAGGPWACRQQRFVICRNLGAQTLEPLIYLL